jgi:hypothetical protein
MLELNPGFTLIPNDFLDQLASDLTAAELRVVLYIYRRTLGYQKLTDAISYSQFTDGITAADGRRLDKGAGISRRSLPAALAGLERRGIISRSSGGSGGVVRYTIVQTQTSTKPKVKAKTKLPEPDEGSGSGSDSQSATIELELTTLPQPGQKTTSSESQLEQKVLESNEKVGQLLPPTKQTESKIKSDRAEVVNLILEEIADITPNQAAKLVEIAEQNRRDISYIQRLVGYVASVAGNPAAMLTTLIKTNQDRTTGSGHGVSHHSNRRKNELPGYDWTLKKPTSRQPIDFSKPFYQRIIAQQNDLSASANQSEAIDSLAPASTNQ